MRLPASPRSLRRRRRRALAAAALVVLAAPLGAQTTAPADAVFARAQRLVNAGRGAEGRALVDSLVRATPATSPRYPDALFWRASLAATAAEAERDYHRIAIEHPLSRRSEDALVRLAQLEMARGDNAQAARHLERLMLEHPGSAGVPRWHYWLARARLAGGDLPRGCAALLQARARAPLSDVELRNEIAYLGARCASVDTTGAAAPLPAPSVPATTPPREPAGASPAGAAVEYTVQVTAYDTKAPAERLRARLAARGWEARVVPAGAMWRVRVGRYATREDAAAAATRLEAQGTSTWVTEAEPR
jgi:hypothetical protein